MLLKLIPICVLAISLGLTGCDSRQENAREDALEAKADGLEDAADKAKSEKTEDALEDKADAVREQK
jgi:hypothetical protein